MVSIPAISIRAKLSTAFLAIVGLLVAVGIYGLIELRSVNEVVKDFANIWLPRIERLEGIKRLAAEERLLDMQRASLNDRERVHETDARIDIKARASLALRSAYRQQLLSYDERKHFIQFEGQWQQYKRAVADPRPLDEGVMSQGGYSAQEVNRIHFDSAMATLDKLIELTTRRSGESATRAHQVYVNGWRSTSMTIALGVLFALAATLWTIRSISTPLRGVAHAMKLLTAGKIEAAQVPDVDRGDEIGALLEAFRGYRKSLIQKSELAQAAETAHARMHAAISNMPVGLAMFDADSQLIISNQTYAEMYGIPEDHLFEGIRLPEILECILGRYEIDEDEKKILIEELVERAGLHERSFRTYDLLDGRTMNITFQPMEEGGWVEVHEDVSERRRQQAQIEHMAKHDALTDLPNRVLLVERAEEALRLSRRGETVGVLCLDLDRFKNVNDTLGHPVGDVLLTMVAERLKKILRDSDTVARVGGDEFMVIQAPCRNPGDSIALAQRIIQQISEPYEIDGRELVIGVSVGIATYPGDGDNVEQLVKRGDIALYRAKADGRGTFRFFEQDMDAKVQARRALEVDMRHALAENEFRLHYQPVVHIDSDNVSSFEALLRWKRPGEGEIAPSEYIPVAEETGLIIPIGEWVLKQACLDAAAWPEDITVAVNISPVQFRSPAFYNSVVSALEASKLTPRRLEIEITEGVLMIDQEATLATLHQLHKLGVRIAMDDFGTGYSSLSYLRSFPFDRIKIDTSFIHNIAEDKSSMAILRAAAGLSLSLGMATTAEGVENEEQLARVKSEGCSDVQGFFFGKAMPVSKVAAFIASRRGSSAPASKKARQKEVAG